MASGSGGRRLELKLGDMARKMTSGTVRVGFLESAMYPVENGTERFLKGVAKFKASIMGPRKPGAKAPGAPSPQMRLPLSGAPLPVAQVAFWNNFGTARSPARPFFSNTVRDKSPAWGEDLGKIAKAMGYNTQTVLRAMGERIKDQIVKAIVDWPSDNAPLTVEIKGFNKGLIDSDVMQRNVDYEVVK
jgi:hypothetical protein